MSKQPKRLRLLKGIQREPKGVEKGEDTRPTLMRFFKLWGRKFWRLISLNLIMLVQILPLLGCLFLYLGGPKVSTQYDPLYSALLGAQLAEPTTLGATLLNDAAGLLHQSPIFNSWAHWVMAALILFQLVTYGWQKVGATYILRNMVRGDGVFLISDFIYAIRRNLKQGLVMGLIDCAAIGALVFDFLFFYGQPASWLNNFMYVMIIALFVIYGIMRFYTYLMLVTFNMKLSKIFKNALIFTALGIRRNIMALLGMVALAGVFAASMLLVSVKLYAVIILPFLCILAFWGFMYTYAAWPIIEKYMIAPPPKKADDDLDGEPEDDGEPATATE